MKTSTLLLFLACAGFTSTAALAEEGTTKEAPAAESKEGEAAPAPSGITGEAAAKALLGTWVGKKDGSEVTFKADGTLTGTEDEEAFSGKYTLDAAASPMSLKLTMTEDEEVVELFTIIEFVDKDTMKIDKASDVKPTEFSEDAEILTRKK